MQAEDTTQTFEDAVMSCLEKEVSGYHMPINTISNIAMQYFGNAVVTRALDTRETLDKYHGISGIYLYLDTPNEHFMLTINDSGCKIDSLKL